MTRILVVDDSAVDRRLVGAVLEQNDEWTIDFAKTGREALEKIEENYPDAIVADLQMPEMNGLELVKVITRRVPVIPVILIT
ncbi:MAG: response regulator, partial [Planctomycetota bacterium]|nr:response regulator [Planctomycetota bacterium]